jgi:2-C-methyl-D-erythritol 2,4-cyclodiphosphate synthase
MQSLSIKCGIGYDIHPLKKGRKLFLGGVEIPYKMGLFGHSDGDVVIHSICDAILGAIGEGDIGEHFPDKEQKYKNISSSFFLEKIKKILKEKKYKIVNIDVIVIAEKPKLLNYKTQMKEKLAKILEINPQKINIKAKTNQKLGIFKTSAAIACFSLAVVSK